MVQVWEQAMEDTAEDMAEDMVTITINMAGKPIQLGSDTFWCRIINTQYHDYYETCNFRRLVLTLGNVRRGITSEI